MSDNGFGTGDAGIFVDPGGGTTLMSLRRVRLERNFGGLRAVGVDSGSIFGSVVDSVALANGSYGFVVGSSGGATGTLDIQRSASNLNGGSAVYSAGVGGGVNIGTSMVTANGTGFDSIGGPIRTYRNNSLDNNSVRGFATSAIRPQ